MRLLCAAVTMAVCGGAGDAQTQTCQSYVGQTVTPKTIEQAIVSLGNVAPKGEFETTAQYQARISTGPSSVPLIISKKPEGPEYFEFDADRQLLAVKRYAFNNMNMDWWDAFYEAKPVGVQASASASNNIAVVISRSDKPSGSYQAQNSFGASTTVTRIDRTSYGIFEHELPAGDWNIFRESNGENLGTIQMDPITAQRVKPTLKIAFAIVPQAPYLVQGNQSVGKTTIDNPANVTEHFKILVADLQCGLLTDGTNKVLAAYAIK